MVLEVIAYKAPTSWVSEESQEELVSSDEEEVSSSLRSSTVDMKDVSMELKNKEKVGYKLVEYKGVKRKLEENDTKGKKENSEKDYLRRVQDSVSFDDATVDPFYPSALFFRLNGKFRECSLVEFSWHMGIYEENKMRSPAFELFLTKVVREYLSGVNGYNFWSTIANGAFHSGVSQESHIRSPIHRLLHRFITFSINHKRHGDKVTSLNLFFLWSIVTPTIFCNIPHHLASYLGSKATISRAGSPINGGHFITLLARSYGLTTPRLTRTLTWKPRDDLSMGYLELMHVVVNVGSHWSIPIDNNVEPHAQPKQQPRPRGRRNMRGSGERG